MSRGAARSVYLRWLADALSPAAGTAEASETTGNLVLGYATGYRQPETEAFVRSLRSVHTGPVALFVDPDPRFRAWLAEWKVESLDASPRAGWTPLPVVARFADYARLLDGRPGLGNVLLADVRDLVFQSDPFARRTSGIEVFVEDEAHAIKQNRFHAKYLRAIAGDAVADRLGEHPCLCAGTIVGPVADMARLCRLIVTLCAIPRSGVGGGFGIDQAALELAVHAGLIAASVQANHGRVATIGMSADGVRLDGDRIVNADGSISPIVHQYDRDPELMGGVRARWSSDAPDRVHTGPQGLKRALGKLRASLNRYLPELR